jgi:hypothetical protein
MAEHLLKSGKAHLYYSLSPVSIKHAKIVFLQHEKGAIV